MNTLLPGRVWLTLFSSLLLSACAPSAPPPSAPVAPAASTSVAAPTRAFQTTPVATPTQVAQAAQATPASSTATISTAHLAALQDLPTYVALDRGYFTSAGVNVELVPFTTSSDEIAALATGKLLVGSGGVNAGLFNAIAQNIPLSVVADMTHNGPDFNGTGWFVREDLVDKIKEPGDLKGAIVAVGSSGSNIDVELDRLLQQGGLTTSDVDVKNISYAEQVAAFANKSIDVAYAFQPFSTLMAAQGVARLWVRSGQIIPDHEGTVILYSPALARGDPAAARAWMVGYLQGVRSVLSEYRQNHNVLPEPLVQLMLKYSALKDPDRIRSLELAGINQDGRIASDTIKTDLDFFVKAGYVTNAPDLANVLDTQYVDYAVSKLGPYAGP